MSPTPVGYVHNKGVNYIPFTITDHHGRATPARFIQVHMKDNLYAIARLTASGADYHREIHAAPVNDVNTCLSVLWTQCCACSCVLHFTLYNMCHTTD